MSRMCRVLYWCFFHDFASKSMKMDLKLVMILAVLDVGVLCGRTHAHSVTYVWSGTYTVLYGCCVGTLCVR
jgi:hypothetical protein